MSEIPVPREREILEKFFTCMMNLTHDKAKEFVDKERDGIKSRSVSLLWTSFLSQLGNLAIYEKGFYSLAFLNQNMGTRFLGRKDVLINRYSFLVTELHKMENAHKQTKTRTSTVDGRQLEGSSITSRDGSSVVQSEETIEQMILSLSDQLRQWATIRTSAIRFYEQLFTAASNKMVLFGYDDVLKIMTDVYQMFSTSITHPVLANIQSSILRECQIATHLVQCFMDMQNYRFISSLAHIKEAKLNLDVWGEEITTLDNTRKFNASAVTSTSTVVSCSSELYDWLVLYKSALLSKFSLYFFEVFILEASLTDVCATMARTSIDYYARFASFHQKSDALSICLVLNTNEERAECYQGAGYHVPSDHSHSTFVIAKPTGLDSFSSIFCYPREKPELIWLSMISILRRKYSELSVADKVVFTYDESGTQNYTYFMIQTDPLVTLVAIYATKKLMKDTLIINFMTSVSSDLRCIRVFALMKSGSK